MHTGQRPKPGSGDGFVGGADNTIVNANWGWARPADDPLLSMAHLSSYQTGSSPLSLCDIGHQGLLLDREFGLSYNRKRYLNPRMGRFLQRDPVRYVDGMGRIDTSLARLVSGGVYTETEKFTEAEKYYSALFEEDSYFSPMGGIELARYKKARGKADKANEVLEQVETRYPGYGPAIQRLKHSWK